MLLFYDVGLAQDFFPFDIEHENVVLKVLKTVWFFKLFYLLVFCCFRFFLFQFNIRRWLSDVLSLNFILATLLILWKNVLYVSPLIANPTKWSNTLKQFIANFPTNCLSVFDHFVILALKGLKNFNRKASFAKYKQTIRMTRNFSSCGFTINKSFTNQINSVLS